MTSLLRLYVGSRARSMITSSSGLRTHHGFCSPLRPSPVLLVFGKESFLVEKDSDSILHTNVAFFLSVVGTEGHSKPLAVSLDAIIYNILFWVNKCCILGRRSSCGKFPQTIA